MKGDPGKAIFVTQLLRAMSENETTLGSKFSIWATILGVYPAINEGATTFQNLYSTIVQMEWSTARLWRQGRRRHSNISAPAVYSIPKRSATASSP